MADDPGILWTLANSFRIWKNGNSEPWNSDLQRASEQWNSGRATDILVRPDGNLVIATDRGGIWLMSESADGTVCVSDRWEDAAFRSLAQGPDGGEHVFAGGVGA